MNVVLLLLGLYSRHLKANSKTLMGKTQRIENYRGSQNVSSYSAYMVTGVTAVNLDSLLRLQWNYISIWLSENVDWIEIFSLSWTKELFLLHRRRKKIHHSLFPYGPASLHKCESFSESDCDIIVCLPFKVNSFNLFTISYYFLSPPLKWSFLLPLFWGVRYYQLIWRVSPPFISYHSRFSNCNF